MIPGCFIPLAGRGSSRAESLCEIRTRQEPRPTAIYQRIASFLLLGWTISAAPAATVETLDGRTIVGRSKLEADGSLLLTPSNTPPVRVPLSNLLRADFTNPTSPAPRLSPRLKPLAMDEERGAMPEPWRNLDIGQLEQHGSAVHYHGKFTLEASCKEQSERRDGYHFVCQSFLGDGEIIARVASLSPRDDRDKQARAGVLIRAGLEPDQRALLMSLTGGGGLFLNRWGSNRGGGAREDRRPDLKPPYWVKLTREGNKISASHSTDGRRWFLFETNDEPMPDRAYFGFVVMSRRRDTSATAEFDHVTVRALEVRGPFTPRLVLEDGTVIADHLRSADDTSITFSADKKGLNVLTRHVARIQFQAIDELEFLPTGRPGVLLASGDFVDGEFQCISNNRVVLGSVLFGQRKIELDRKVAAVVLRDAQSPPLPFEVKTLDGSLWRARSIAIESGALKVETPLTGTRRIPSGEIREISRTSPSQQGSVPIPQPPR